MHSFDIPTDPEQIRDLLGVGWWKYDPDEAAKLLKSVGFKKAGDKWQTPDGKPWTISILAPADFDVESQRLAFAVWNYPTFLPRPPVRTKQGCSEALEAQRFGRSGQE